MIWNIFSANYVTLTFAILPMQPVATCCIVSSLWGCILYYLYIVVVASIDSDQAKSFSKQGEFYRNFAENCNVDNSYKKLVHISYFDDSKKCCGFSKDTLK